MFHILHLVGGSGVWGGILGGQHRHIYMLARETMTAVGNRDDSRRHMMSDAMGLGFLLGHDKDWPHRAGVFQQFLKERH